MSRGTRTWMLASACGAVLVALAAWAANAPATEAAANARGTGAVASAPAADTGDVPSFRPLLDAAAGEWAEYRGLEGRRLRYEVVELTVDRVRTRVRVWDQGKPLGQPAMREDMKDEDFLARQAAIAQAKRQATRERITAAGRTWNALVYEDRWTDEEVAYIRRTWVSGEAPAFGVVKMELHGDGRLEASLELKSFGDGKAAER